MIQYHVCMPTIYKPCRRNTHHTSVGCVAGMCASPIRHQPKGHELAGRLSTWQLLPLLIRHSMPSTLGQKNAEPPPTTAAPRAKRAAIYPVHSLTDCRQPRNDNIVIDWGRGLIEGRSLFLRLCEFERRALPDGEREGPPRHLPIHIGNTSYLVVYHTGVVALVVCPVRSCLVQPGTAV